MSVKTLFALEAQLVNIDISCHNNVKCLPFVSHLFSTSLLFRWQDLFQGVDTL